MVWERNETRISSLGMKLDISILAVTIQWLKSVGSQVL